MSRHRSPARLPPRHSFELFVTRVEELSQTTIIKQNALNSQWTLSMGVDQPLTCKSIEPNEDLLNSYLMKFRKFISKDEPVYISYIHGLCQKHFTSDELKGSIKRCQDGWRRTLENNGVRLMIGGKEITPEYLGDLWINGHYFHDDPDKFQELKRCLSSSFIFARHEFIAYVLEATRVIGGTGHAIKAALREGSLNV